MRIGHGYDTHRLIFDKKLILGGVTIPYEKGLEAHSDGDAVIHSLCNALLGAAALGDIGFYFPDHNKKFKDIDSRILLKKVYDLIRKKKYGIENIDISIIAQAPKMAPYISAMKQNLGDDLGLDLDQISIKANTAEGMGYIGEKKGIAVHTVILLT